VQTLCLQKGAAPTPGLLFAHTLVLALAQAAAKGAMQTIMSPIMTASQTVPSSASIYTLRMTTTEDFTVQKKYTVCATFAAPKAKKKKYAHM
jgi:hypothetical protein